MRITPKMKRVGLILPILQLGGNGIEKMMGTFVQRVIVSE